MIHFEAAEPAILIIAHTQVWVQIYAKILIKLNNYEIENMIGLPIVYQSYIYKIFFQKADLRVQLFQQSSHEL